MSICVVRVSFFFVFKKGLSRVLFKKKKKFSFSEWISIYTFSRCLLVVVHACECSCFPVSRFFSQMLVFFLLFEPFQVTQFSHTLKQSLKMCVSISFFLLIFWIKSYVFNKRKKRRSWEMAKMKEEEEKVNFQFKKKSIKKIIFFNIYFVALVRPTSCIVRHEIVCERT